MKYFRVTHKCFIFRLSTITRSQEREHPVHFRVEDTEVQRVNMTSLEDPRELVTEQEVELFQPRIFVLLYQLPLNFLVLVAEKNLSF